MTRDEIAIRVSRELEDSGNIHFTVQEVNDSIQDGYDIISLLTESIEKTATVSFVGNQTYYNLRTLISDYYRVFAIYHNNTKRWLTPIAYRVLDDFSISWETTNGNAEYFASLGWDKIAIYRKPATTTGSMLVFYKAVAGTLSGSTVPEFPPHLHETLVMYAIGDLLDQDLEYTKAQIYMKKFYEKIGEVKKVINTRSLPDRLLVLSARYSMPLVEA